MANLKGNNDMKLIIATHNENKALEIRDYLKNQHQFEILTLNDLGITDEVEETGATFRENALLKANTIMRLTGHLTIADDSGLEIDSLDKQPGIMSARYLGKDTPYTVKNEIILEKLAETTSRTARFVSAMAISSPDCRPVVMQGILEGQIAFSPQGDNGFGYDPIFIPLGMHQTMAEISLEEKNKISHRAIALRETVAYLLNLIEREENI